MVIAAFVMLFVVIAIGYVQSFPGGVKGFISCLKASMKKGLGHKTKPLERKESIRWRGTQRPCGSYHPRQQQGQLQKSSRYEQPQEKPTESDEQLPSEQRCRGRPEP